MSIIIESQYFACISYFAAVSEANNCEIEAYERFSKMSFRNRCIIAGSNGLINLSIPLEGGRNNKLLMKDVTISYSDNWQTQHIKAITSSYARSPFFEYYFTEIEKIIKQKHIFLLDKNLEALEWSKKVLKLKTVFNTTTAYNATAENKDLRNHWLPNNYIEKNTIEQWYYQVFQDKNEFHPNLSILDLLFCEGPNATRILGESNKEIAMKKQ